jgi:hypothetical protein
MEAVQYLSALDVVIGFRVRGVPRAISHIMFRE